MAGQLFFGDNLQVMRENIRDESVDLIYLDPPFNSNATYNVLFKTPKGQTPDSQIQAFDDTWHWSQAAAVAYDDVMRSGSSAATMLRALRNSIGENDMMAYLTMMCVRLIEMRRILKPAGSLYLHCDPTASHYLKIVLDAIFGPSNFANEIVWQRNLAKALMSRRLPTNHDTILCYGGGGERVWNADELYIPYDESNLPEKIAQKYSAVDENGRRYQLTSLINPNPNRPNLTYEFMGVTRVWRWTKERMEQALSDGMIVQTAPGRVPRLKRYLDEQRGMPLGDVWTDIPPLNSQARERLGYPTQKPLALLKRIIAASSNTDMIVFDPFCGCGTAIHAAEDLDRHWIGIDVTHLAIQVIRDRFKRYLPSARYEVGGIPASIDDARALANHSKIQFEFWAVSHIGGHPKGYAGADRGIDGQFFFKSDSKTDGFGLISVKGGRSINPAMIRELRGTLEREGADIGVFICLDEPTRAMKTEAASADPFVSASGDRFPRLQILSLEDIFSGRGIQCPPLYTTVTMADAARQAKGRAQRKPTLTSQELLKQRNLLLPIAGGKRSAKSGQARQEPAPLNQALRKAI